MSLLARTAVHKARRVGGLDTRGVERVFVADLSVWFRLAVGLGWKHTLDSSMFVTNGSGTDLFGAASTTAFYTGGSLRVDGSTPGGVEGGWTACTTGGVRWLESFSKSSSRSKESRHHCCYNIQVPFKNPQQNIPPLLSLYLVSGYLLFNTGYRAAH